MLSKKNKAERIPSYQAKSMKGELKEKEKTLVDQQEKNKTGRNEQKL